tara:strand:- start:1075 stop:2082 length:1008 start_codon:yes stop_codon:yes gene_type:complete
MNFESTCNNLNKNIYNKQRRVIAIGDIHGDLNMLILLLNNIKLVNKNNEWLGKDTYIVIVGDIMDSCRKDCPFNNENEKNTTFSNKGDLDILYYLYNLNKLALKKNGRIITLLGNHEIMNFMNDYRYNSAGDIYVSNKYNFISNEIILNKKFKEISFNDALKKKNNLFTRGNEFSKFIACNTNSVVIIGSWLFSHAGILPDLAKKYSVSDINKSIRLWLIDNISTDDKKFHIEKMISDAGLSPFWNRIFGRIPVNETFNSQQCETYLEPVLKIYKNLEGENISNMVIGHTPQNKISSTCSKKLYKIDIAMSKAFNGSKKPHALEIINDIEVNVIY